MLVIIGPAIIQTNSTSGTCEGLLSEFLFMYGFPLDGSVKEGDIGPERPLSEVIHYAVFEPRGLALMLDAIMT